MRAEQVLRAVEGNFSMAAKVYHLVSLFHPEPQKAPKQEWIKAIRTVRKSKDS